MKSKHNCRNSSFIIDYPFYNNNKVNSFAIIKDRQNKFVSSPIGFTEKNMFFYGFILNKQYILEYLQQPNIIINDSLDIQASSPIDAVSPIVEGSKYREAFNALGIQGLNNQNNVEIINIIQPTYPVELNRSRPPTELLNYRSNILYVIINGLSPRIY